MNSLHIIVSHKADSYILKRSTSAGQNSQSPYTHHIQV